jgi:hypothetical protein
MMKKGSKRIGKRTIKLGKEIGFTYWWFDNMDKLERLED